MSTIHAITKHFHLQTDQHFLKQRTPLFNGYYTSMTSSNAWVLHWPLVLIGLDLLFFVVLLLVLMI
jgi:hypothetical protein